jgi:four helix bundle protein
MGDYRELVFYQKSREVTMGCNRLIKNWPKSMQAQEIGRQMFRSATSVGANIAEGHGRYEGVEYVRYLVIAQASANETDHWLNTAHDIGLGSEQEIQSLIKLNIEVRKMLTASIKTMRGKLPSKATREGKGEYKTEFVNEE